MRCNRCWPVHKLRYNNELRQRYRNSGLGKNHLLPRNGTMLSDKIEEKEGHIPSWLKLQRLMASGRFKGINGQYRSD